MGGHVGVASMGAKGAIYPSPPKLKINTTSPTGSGVVGVGGGLPKHLWFRGSRVGQGGYPNGDILYQDNGAPILVGGNGGYPCKEGMRHVHIRYSSITDRIKGKGAKVVYCPTGPMVSGSSTKPLQGGLPHKSRDIILGIDPEDYEVYQGGFGGGTRG